MKIELNEIETEALFSLLNDAIINHRQESMLKFKSGEIDLNRHEWDLSHAKFLEELKAKLLNSDHR
jgi:hypothetical protein